MASTAPFRVHIQNPPDDKLFEITTRQWQEACARNPEAAEGVEVSFASDDAGFTAAMPAADAVISWTSEIRKRFPCPAPRLKLIQCTSAGLDRLAPYGWVPPGVWLCNNAGTHSAKAGEFGIMAILMLANHMPLFASCQRKGQWHKAFGSVLAGRTVVIVGVGSLGGGVAQRAKQFDLHVIGVRTSGEPHPHCDRVVADADLDSVLPLADFLVLTMPLTPKTKGMITAARLDLLKPGAGLVNLARGAVIDQDAMIARLESGRLGGAVCDVFVPEPVPPEHRLWTTPNLVMTPHMCADDPNTYNPSTLDIFFRNLTAWRRGARPPNAIDTARGY